jgi:hypothetical protein
MSVIDLRTYRRSPSSSALAFDEPIRDWQRTSTYAPSTDFSSDDSIPLFLSDFQGQPGPREFEPLASSQASGQASGQQTNILTRVVAGGLVVSAFAILVAVGVFNSNAKRGHIDKEAVPMVGATADQSAMPAASPPAVRQLPPKELALVSDPATPASVNASSPRMEPSSPEAVVSANDTAPQSQTAAAPIGNEAAAPSKMLDAGTLVALMTRAGRLLELGDIAAARLLLERAANAQNATAAFMLAQTYDPAVLGVLDARSTKPDPVMARNWYRTAASFGSEDAQQRLTQLRN